MLFYVPQRGLGLNELEALRFVFLFLDFLLTIYYFGVDSIGDERWWVVFARGRVSFELEFVGGKVASALI